MLVEPNPSAMGPEISDELQRARKLADLHRLRALLTGTSVVDSEAMAVPDRDAVDHHLRLCEFDTDNPLDLSRLRGLLADAIAYLRDLHHYEFPLAIEEPESIHDVFMLAALGTPHERHLAITCIKVMHILHHIAGQEVVHTAAVSEVELVDRLNTKVLRVVDQLRTDGVGIVEWAAGKKTKHSLVTKLLAKRETLASRIFDRLRYRIVTRDRRNLVLAIVGLADRLVPFNYVVPGQSQNGILSLNDVADALELDHDLVASILRSGNFGDAPTPQNEFSGATYRCANFVADIPIRIDDHVAGPAIAFVQAEFQLVDEETNDNNNQGDNAHGAYKARQLAVVKRRLERLR